MKRIVGKSWLVAVALLIIAQAGAIAHAFEHDPGMHQDKICASCVTASQLSSACVGSVTVPEIHFSVSFLERSRQVLAATACVQMPRQRGPPPSS